MTAPTREAARLAELEAPEGELAGLLRWKIDVPFGIVAVVFLVDGDPLFSVLAIALAVVVRWIARSMVTSGRKNAERHLALLEAEIARLC